MLCQALLQSSYWAIFEFLTAVQALAILQQVVWAVLVYPYLMSRAELEKMVQLTIMQSGRRAEETAFALADAHLRAYRIGECARWHRIAREIRRAG